MTIEEERDAARREGVRREENLPFLLEPARPGAAGILLVHGFTASPWEMRTLGTALKEAGYSAMGVRLPGHGTTPEDLAGRRWEEWLEAVERGYGLLAGRCSRIYGVGMSTGALLLLPLAERFPLGGLVLLSPYLRLRHPLAAASVLLRFVRPFQKHRISPDLRPFYYERRPVQGVFQLHRLLRRVRPALSRVTVPVLTVGALGDRVIRLSSTLELFRGLGSRRRELHLYGPEVPHVLITGENPRRQETLQIVLEFIKDLEAAAVGKEGRKVRGPGSRFLPWSRNCR